MIFKVFKPYFFLLQLSNHASHYVTWHHEFRGENHSNTALQVKNQNTYQLELKTIRA